MKTNILLKAYSVTLTFILLFILITGYRPYNEIEQFKEINVERINIIEPDGKLKMVISNRDRQHPGMINGELHGKRERPPGILFFNEEQDEIGGIGFHGNGEIGGNQTFMSFDQYKNDQVMHMMHYTDEQGDNKYGLLLWDRAKEFQTNERLEIMDSLERAGLNYRRKLEVLKEMNGGEPVLASRLFLGRNYDRTAGLFLRDRQGIERLRFYIDAENNPKIELLDENGNLVKNILEEN